MHILLNATQIRVEFEERQGYLLFRILGPYRFEEYKDALHAMNAACLERSLKKAIIDITAIEGDIPQFDRYNLGIEFAEIWGREPKVAVLAPSPLVNRFFENTAVNRQARVKVFPDEPSGLVWLMQD